MSKDVKKNYRKNDEYYTPPNAVRLITPYLEHFNHVWCPFDTSDSNYVKELTIMGIKVTNTHIWEGQDFFETEMPTGCDCIVSNPPYSIKKQIISRLIELETPFAMLLNASSIFDSKVMFNFAKEYDLEIMYIYPRIEYIYKHELRKGVMFQSCYLCRKVLGSQLVFQNYDREGDRLYYELQNMINQK